jgi:hypothetical protein
MAGFVLSPINSPQKRAPARMRRNREKYGGPVIGHGWCAPGDAGHSRLIEIARAVSTFGQGSLYVLRSLPMLSSLGK